MNALFIFLSGLALFLSYQVLGISGGDSGDLVTAAATFGVPHPSGYPLYTFFGWLLWHIPLYTPVWRITLLSSIPHAASAALLYLIVKRLTKSSLVGMISSILFIGNYLVFLYSITPEVFALLDLFILFLSYVLLCWYQTGNRIYWYLFLFVFGLSLTHHHVIVFSVPALFYVVWSTKIKQKKSIGFSFRFALLSIGCFFLGFIPYLYVPLAAVHGSIVNWDHASTLSGFIRLVTRADYGSFLSNSLYGSLPVQRFLSLKAYTEFLRLDFGILGIGVMLYGICTLLKTSRNTGLFFLLNTILLGPFFLFYASFPLMNRFTVGTYERFLLPSYTLLPIFFGCGLNGLIDFIKHFVRMKKRRVVFTSLLVVIVLLHPLQALGMSLWRFYGVRFDKTGDALGLDILQSVIPGSMVLLSNDTPLFTTQYVRYVLGKRRDVTLIHANRIENVDYQKDLSRIFPSVRSVLPITKQPVEDFIKANRDRFPIYSNNPYPEGPGWFWVPTGLIYRLVREKDLPTVDVYMKENDGLWKTLHNPLSGILSRYPHLMLSDVLNVYAAARFVYGKTLMKANRIVEAKNQFAVAASYQGDTETSDAYLYQGITRLFLKDCRGALDKFQQSREVAVIPDPEVVYFEAVTYRDCLGDAKTGALKLRKYSDMESESAIPIEGSK